MDFPGPEEDTAWCITDCTASLFAIGAPEVFVVPASKMVRMRERVPINRLEINRQRSGDFAQVLDLTR